LEIAEDKKIIEEKMREFLKDQEIEKKK